MFSKTTVQSVSLGSSWPLNRIVFRTVNQYVILQTATNVITKQDAINVNMATVQHLTTPTQNAYSHKALIALREDYITVKVVPKLSAYHAMAHSYSMSQSTAAVVKTLFICMGAFNMLTPALTDAKNVHQDWLSLILSV